MPKCEECGRTQFFWHGFTIGVGLATCLRCKTLNNFEPEPEGNMAKKRKTIGERVAAAILPCVNVYGSITVSVPYEGTRLGDIRVQTDHRVIDHAKAESEMKRLRRKIARYVDRLVSKETAGVR